MGDLDLQRVCGGEHCSDHRRNPVSRPRVVAGSTVGARNRGGGVMEQRLPKYFFALCMLALVLMLGAIRQASAPSWKRYQADFHRLAAAGEPNAATKNAELG